MNLSVRARLTLWNVGIVAALLLTLGVAVRTIVRTSLLDGIDHELTERATTIVAETARRIRRENGTYVFVGRDRRGVGGKPRTFRIDSPFDKSDRAPAPPTPPPNDPYAPRFLNVDGEPPLPFFRLPAWDKPSVNTARQTKRTVLRTTQSDGEPFRVVTVPVRVPGDTGGNAPAFVQIAFRLTDIERGLTALDNALLALLPLSLLVAGASGAVLTGRALRPVRDISLATDQIAANRLGERLPVVGRDEFSELSRRLNQMLERLETAFDKQQRFVADASHELRTPLAIVTAHTSLALDDESPATPAQAQSALRAIHAAAGRMSRITTDLLLLAGGDANGTLPRDHKPVSLGDTLNAAIADAQTVCHERTGSPGATITRTEHEDVVVPDADPQYLRRVFVNLLENALRYTPPTGSISVDVATTPGAVTVRISDTGCGIAPEHLPRLFDRFYRADAGRDRTRGGTGLGLSIVQTLVHAHGGAVSVDSTPGRGTTVMVTLPK